MRILGLLFVLFGLVLCFTVLLAGAGLPCIGVGALLCIAGRDKQPGSVAHATEWIIGGCIVVVLVIGVLGWYGILNTQRQVPAATPHLTAFPSTPRKPAKKPVRQAGEQGQSSAAPSAR